MGKQTKIIISKNGSIKLGLKNHFDDFCEVSSKNKLSCGDRVFLNPFSRIIAHESISIGSNVVIARYVSILDHDHAFTYEGSNLIFSGYKTKPIIIGDNVWIGDKCTILKGVTIGSNVIIGANSIVNKDIPSNCIAVGSPCKPVKSLKP